MRKIIVLTFISLDGVMQAPGGSEEDKSSGFKYGGWTFPYFDESMGQVMTRQMSGKYDLLLGRKTYEIFASYWPEHESEWPEINNRTKYVVSKKLKKHEWENSVFFKSMAAVKKLKEAEGFDLQVHGSSDLIQSLIKHDLVDEYWLKIFPVTLGKGKRLFTNKAVPAAFELTESKVSPSGVIVANYKRSGKVKTGSFE